MKRLIALMICALLLLSGCTAATLDSPGTGFQVRDMMVLNGVNCETLDMTGLAVTGELASSDSSMGVRLYVDANGQTGAEAFLGVVGQYLYLSLTGPEGTRNLALDLAKVTQVLSDAYNTIYSTITGILPSIFTGTDSPEGAAYRAAGTADGLPGSASAGMDPSALYQDTVDELTAIMSRCVTAEEQQIDGETLQVLTIDVTAEDMAGLLDTVDLPIQGVGNLGQLLASYDITCALAGTVTADDDFSRYRLDLTPTFTSPDGTIAVNYIIDAMAGDSSFTVSVGSSQNGQEGPRVQLTFSSTEVNSADWLPAELAPDTILLNNLSPNGALDTVTESLISFLDQAADLASAQIEANG